MTQEGASTNGGDSDLVRELETLKSYLVWCRGLVSQLLLGAEGRARRQEPPYPPPSPLRSFDDPLAWVNACLEQKGRAPVVDPDLPRLWERWSVSLWEEALLPGEEGRGRVFLVVDGETGVVIPDPWWLRSDYHGFLSRGGEDLKAAYVRAFECVAPSGYAWPASYHVEEVARVRRSSQGGWEVVQRGKLEFRPM